MKFNKLMKSLLLLSCLFMTTACFNSGNTDTDQTGNSQTVGGSTNNPNKDYIFDLGDGLVITEITDYDGVFVEDGTNEKVKNVLAIVVKNTSGSTLQYCEITISGGNGVANFKLSTLGPNESALVLESSRQKYIKKKDTYLNATVNNVVYFREGVSIHSDKILIQGLDGAFNVKNVSDKLIQGPIYIYYKNVDDNYYLGGITYRCKVENIKAGEIKQVMTNHYNKDNSKIVFVTIGQ